MSLADVLQKTNEDVLTRALVRNFVDSTKPWEVHPKIVQEILGHSQISVTVDTYSHVLPTMQAEVMKRLNDVLQG